MITKFNDKIIINYNIKDKNEIRLFGKTFLKNNKDNCRIKIENKEYELMEYFNIKLYNYSYYLIYTLWVLLKVNWKKLII